MCARTDAVSAPAALRQHGRRLPRHPGPCQEPPPFPRDSLARLTSLYQRLLLRLPHLLFDHSFFRVILRSPQLAHMLMLVAVFFVCSSVMQLASNSPPSPVINLAYIASYSIHFGNQFWMTFVSGLALLFNLPRHDFGAVQKVLFPIYFTLNSCLSFMTLISFTKLHYFSNLRNFEIVQVVALCVCFTVELAVRLYVVPSVIHLMVEKTALEKSAGVGREVGQFDPGPLMACPHYSKLHMQFRRQHTLVAAGNIIAMACSSLHLYYLAVYWQLCTCCPT